MTDSERLKIIHTLRPLDEWHEDYGTVLWWHLPIQEPPYVGQGPGMGESTLDGGPTTCRKLIEYGWLTHWSPLPFEDMLESFNVDLDLQVK